VSALLNELMSLQRIFPRECFSASTVAQKRFLPTVRLPMALQVVLAIK